MSKDSEKSSRPEPGAKPPSPLGRLLERIEQALAKPASAPTEDQGSGGGKDIALVLLIGAVLLFAGQALRTPLLEHQRFISTSLTVIGLLLFVLAVRSFSTGGFPVSLERWVQSIAGWLGASKAQLYLLALAPLLSLAAWFAAGKGMLMSLPLIAPLFWLVAVGLMIAATWEEGAWRKPASWDSTEVIILLGLFVGAFLARGLHIAQIPWLLTGDEASGGLSAMEFIQGLRDNPFTVAWLSFPSLYFFVQSLFIRIFQPTVEALRWSSVLVGALTAPILYLYLKEAFGRGVALAGAFYLSAFHFHIHFSRLGLNNVWDGFFIVLLSAAFWRGWKGGNRLFFTLAGLTFGLAQYFYASSRMLLLLFPLWLAVAAIRDRQTFRKRLPGLAVMLLAAVVIVLPLGMYYLERPDAFLAPLTRVTYLGRIMELDMQETGKSPLALLATQFKTSALAFTGTNLRFWYQPQHPMLMPLPATLFLMGVVLLILHLGKLPQLWLILWMAGAITAGALSESVPAAQRYVFAAPAVAAIVALPIERTARWFTNAWPSMRTWIVAALALIVIYAAWRDLRFYFGEFSANRRFGDLNTETANAVAKFLQDENPAGQVYFFGGRMGYRSHSTIPYLVPEARGEDVLEPLTAPPSWSLDRRTTFIFLPEREGEVTWVEQAYPGGSTHSQEGKETTLFIAYTVSGG